MKLETLYHRGSSEAIYSWRVWTEGADICTEYGQLEGKKQTARKKAEAKNVDKTNATTPETQAISEAKSMWTHRVERKYRRTLEEAKKDEVFLPMLAHPFEKRRGQKKEGHTYPCDVQPKLDGVRCLAYWEEDEIKLLSRGGKDYTCPHITDVLRPILPPGMVLDGELYLHGTSLQTIASWVKRLQPNTYKIQYHVYDCVLLDDMDAKWNKRYNALHAFTSGHASALGDTVHLVDTFEAKNEEEILSIFGKVVEEGYEGAIVRMHDGSEYRFGYRSNRLLKFKMFEDAEYKVIGVRSGKGRFAKCAIWTCAMPTGKDTFEAVSKGTMEEREEMLRNSKDYIGQMLTVKYHGKTDDGIPKFGVGVAFRMPEDM